MNYRNALIATSIAIIVFMAATAPKFGDYSGEPKEPVEFTDTKQSYTEIPYISAMPCERVPEETVIAPVELNSEGRPVENIERYVYELETEEERGIDLLPNADEEAEEASDNSAGTEEYAEVREDEVETVQEYYTEQENTESPLYSLLRAQLDAKGISWWLPYAVAQIQLESAWNPWAENPNGLDKGLLQYRITYWQEPEDIFDVNAQIRRYTNEVSARINAGLSIEEIISRHYTSDYVTEINWEYVNNVLRYLQ